MIILRIRELAELQGCSMQELARRTGLALRTVRKYWDNPRANMSTTILDKFARALQVDASKLIVSEAAHE